jgi:hypothetical protein
MRIPYHKEHKYIEIQRAAEITLTFRGVTARAVEGYSDGRCLVWLAVVLPFSDNAMSCSGEHRGFVVETFSTTMNL